MNCIITHSVLVLWHTKEATYTDKVIVLLKAMVPWLKNGMDQLLICVINMNPTLSSCTQK